ncbi:MAG: phosphotransferase [Curvibacter sp.]|nr:phosphotransferase [Curvibacter sp.]
MTQPVPPSVPPSAPAVSAPPPQAQPQPALHWDDPQRAAAFQAWLGEVAPAHGLVPASVVLASADASFRRYLRIDSRQGSRIIMDAPPERENCAPFVHVAGLMQAAGLHVPDILAWDRVRGFMLLSDLGTHTMMSALDPERPQDAAPLYRQATDTLLAWQQASRPGELPDCDAALLQRELALFPEWYVGRHRQFKLDDSQRSTLSQAFDTIVAHNLAAPRVHVHRDFMARNLMLPQTAGGPLGVLDFQDAIHGPITYDIASLLRDAFLSWEEDFVIDITVRYWEKARKLGLLDFEDWHSDFGAFYRSVEWMGLQRHLKVAGIFARLTLRDGKPRYLADTPRFIAYIRSTAHRYRPLAPLLRLIDQIENLQAASGYAFGRV